MIQVSLSQSQADFLTSDSYATLFAAGIGCLHESSLIDTPSGQVSIGEAKGQYRSFDGLRFSYSLGSAPFPKGKGNLYRVIHEHGELLAHESHALLCADGEYRLVREPLVSLRSDRENSFCRALTSLELCLLRSQQDARHLMRIASSYLDDYSAYCRQYGLRPLEVLNSAQSFVPLLVDALEFYLSFAHKDGPLELGRSSSRLDQLTARPSTKDSSRLAVDLALALGDFLLAFVIERTSLGISQSARSQMMSEIHHIAFVSNLCRTLVLTLTRPYAETKVISIEKHSEDWYWDLQVPNFHNYTGSGLIHHNSGKSFVGSHWAKEKIFNEPKGRGFIGANTYSQLKNATLATFFSVMDEHNVRYEYNQNRGIITVGRTKIYAYSLDNYHNIRGIEIGWAWLDETRDTKREAFDVILGRMRDRRTNKRQIKLTSSPSGFNWLYDYFAGPSKKKGYRIITGSSMDNPFLPEGYVDSLKDSYDEKMYQQEVLGQFVSTGVGQVYYAFSREKNVSPVIYNPQHKLMVGMDFNVNPMTAVVFQAYGGALYVLAEVYLMTSDTHQMGLKLIADWGSNLRVIPDSTGTARRTSAKGMTDHQILKDLGLEVIYNHNPARFDRYVCVNNLCEKSRLVIDPKCVNLIRDLEQLNYKEGTTEPNISNDKSLGHISDALGYGAWFSYPIIKPASGVSMSSRGYG